MKICSRKKLQIVFVFFLVASMVLPTFFGCFSADVQKAEVSLVVTQSSLEIPVGGNVQLTAESSDSEVEWYSVDPSIASANNSRSKPIRPRAAK